VSRGWGSGGRVRQRPEVDRRKLNVRVRMSMAVYDRVIEVSEKEGRPFSQVTGALMLLGCGVWRRLREDPRLLKSHVFGDKSELLLLADFQLTNEIREVMEEAAEAVIARDRKRRAEDLKERSPFY
jgi:hypothetical protein